MKFDKTYFTGEYIISSKNKIIKVVPDKIQFCYSKLESYKQTFTIHNLSGKAIHIKIDGTLNEYFIVYYDNKVCCF